MRVPWHALPSLSLLFVLGCKAMEGRSFKPSTPRFVVISFAHERAKIVEQGAMSRETFRRLFLDHYGLRGERYHPGKDAVVYGVLLASDESAIVTVPIRTWKAEDGAPRFLCQASDDGKAPAFSVFSLSESDLLTQVSKELRVGPAP
jgi:hypothetical protein